jgi:hypothetical protein
MLLVPITPGSLQMTSTTGSYPGPGTFPSMHTYPGVPVAGIALTLTPASAPPSLALTPA